MIDFMLPFLLDWVSVRITITGQRSGKSECTKSNTTNTGTDSSSILDRLIPLFLFSLFGRFLENTFYSFLLGCLILDWNIRKANMKRAS